MTPAFHLHGVGHITYIFHLHLMIPAFHLIGKTSNTYIVHLHLMIPMFHLNDTPHINIILMTPALYPNGHIGHIKTRSPSFSLFVFCFSFIFFHVGILTPKIPKTPKTPEIPKPLIVWDHAVSWRYLSFDIVVHLFLFKLAACGSAN